MAIIILEPNEEFEHIHKTDSTTEVLEGDVLITMGSKEFKGPLNEEIIIPANTPHKLKNLGNTRAKIGCGSCEPINPPTPPNPPPPR